MNVDDEVSGKVVSTRFPKKDLALHQAVCQEYGVDSSDLIRHAAALYLALHRMDSDCVRVIHSIPNTSLSRLTSCDSVNTKEAV